jgi:hypothetical protein
LGIVGGVMAGPYSSFMMDLLSKDNYRYRKENEQLKDMITKFISGEYTKDQLSKEYKLLIDRDKKNEQ